MLTGLFRFMASPVGWVLFIQETEGATKSWKPATSEDVKELFGAKALSGEHLPTIKKPYIYATNN